MNLRGTEGERARAGECVYSGGTRVTGWLLAASTRPASTRPPPPPPPPPAPATSHTFFLAPSLFPPSPTSLTLPHHKFLLPFQLSSFFSSSHNHRNTLPLSFFLSPSLSLLRTRKIWLATPVSYKIDRPHKSSPISLANSRGASVTTI